MVFTPESLLLSQQGIFSDVSYQLITVLDT